MNDKNLISIDDDSLENVAGGFGLLACLIVKPVAIVTGILSSLFGGCEPKCAPKYDDCKPKKRGC